jgi:hypothetical protein
MSLIFTWPGLLKAKLYKPEADSLVIGGLSVNSAGDLVAKDLEADDLTVGGLNIDSDGHLTLTSEATTWEDISEPLNGDNLYSTPGTADYDWDELCVTLAPSGNIANNSDLVTQVYQLRHATKPSSVLKFHIHWEQKDATARTFTWKYRLQNQGEAKTTAWSNNIVVSSTANNAFPYTSGTLNQITALGDISTVGLHLSSIVQIKLTRSDAVAGTINATFIDMHYQADSLGSNSEYIK